MREPDSPAMPVAMHKWQPIPGAANAFAYSYIRRPDVLSCNSYLVEFPACRVLIDAGALPRQTQEILGILSEREQGRPLPLLVFLTHCHHDHSREAGVLLSLPTRPVCLAVQEEGARALAEADVQKTVTELYGRELTPVHAQIPLLTKEDCRALRPRRIAWAGGVEGTVRTEAVDGAGAFRQVLDLDGGGQMPDGSSRTQGQLRSFIRRFALAGYELFIEPERFRLIPSE